MARKNIGRILSGGAIIFCIVLLCALGIEVQAFEAQKVTFTISGSVTLSDGSGGLDGVTMKGLPNEPVTGSDGAYSATVEYGWGGRVTPVKEGYTFEPGSKNYTKVAGNQSNEDYTATVKTFTISGTTIMEGVVMNGLPGNPITGKNGTYSTTVEYGWTGTVTPQKEGYTFSPNSRPYSLAARNMTNQNYKPILITYTISGSAEVDGVVMNGLPGNPVTGRNGIYSATVKFGFSGMVTPKKEGYTFEPAERQYTELMSSQTNEDYTATVQTFTISGTAGIDGVEMTGLPGNPITDASGYYSASIDYGFSGRVTPTKEGYTFEPASRIYSKTIGDRDSEDYTATVKTLIISGTTGMEGVVMNGLPGDPMTGRGGTYKATIEYGWSGTVIPEKEGYTFSPDSKTYGLIARDQMNQNYSGTQITYIISGSVGVDGVVMSGLPNNPITDRVGIYKTPVKYGFTGRVTPKKEGYTFEPAERQYDNIIGDLANEDYTATLLKRTIAGTIISDKGQPVEGVFVVADAGGGSGTTDASGRYELLVDHGWRGKITPTKDGYTFKPTARPYTLVTRDQTNQRYAATLLTFTISGAVIIGGIPVDGVLMSASEGGGSDTTDAKGKYSIKVPYGWTGEITPQKEGFIFNPPSEPYTNVTQNYRDGFPETIGGPRPPRPTTVPPAERVPTVPPAERVPTVPPLERVPTVPPPERRPPVEAPKTPLEREIDSIQEQLAELLRRAAEEAAPPGAPAEEVLITNTFVDNDLVTEVLQTIASQAGVAIIPDETVVGVVTCDLKAVPLDTALEIVLAGTPYVVKKTPYYYLVCSAGLTDAMFPVVSETRRVKLNYVPAVTAVGLLSTAFRTYVQAEQPLPGTPAAGAPRTKGYTVLVTAPPALMNRIISDLEQIDQPPRHVLLDARVVVMERGDLLNLGVEWGWPNIRAGLFSNNLYGLGTAAMADFGGKSPWGIQIGYTPDATFTGSLEMTLNLLAENGEATILSSPQVLAQDGKQSQIQVLTEEYYMLTAPELAGIVGYQRTELAQITSGTTLTITPHIGDNNDITLEVAVEVSDSIPRGRGSDLPVVTRRTASNVVRVRDGGTVALAGLTENRTQLSRRRVPGISRVPILGALFRSNESDESTRELAVFVTARLVSETGRPVNFGGPPAPSPPVRAPAPIGPQLRGNQGFRMQLRESMSRF